MPSEISRRVGTTAPFGVSPWPGGFWRPLFREPDGRACDASREICQMETRILLGASLKVIAPTGQCDPAKLVNWGINRWAFKNLAIPSNSNREIG
jgi:hypothetical protein